MQYRADSLLYVFIGVRGGGGGGGAGGAAAPPRIFQI